MSCPMSFVLTVVAVVATAVVAVPDVTIPVEPIYNTGGNQCYDEHNNPQVRRILGYVIIIIIFIVDRARNNNNIWRYYSLIEV